MNNYNYLNYVVIEGTETLIKAHSGFAADAWKEGDKAFGQIMAETFVYIDGETGKQFSTRKWNVRRLNSDKEFERLYAKTHPAFKFWIEAEKLVKSTELTMSQRVEAHSWLLVGFTTLLDDYPYITPKQWFKSAIFGE